MGWTTDDLLSAVRRAAFLPDDSDQSDLDLLAFADDELDTLIASTIRPGREGHWLATADQDIVPGTAEYTVDRRALGRTVRAVMAVRPDGSEYAIDPLDPVELRMKFEQGATAEPRWYAFEAETIRLGAVPTETGWTLRLLYLRQPPKLVPTSYCFTVVEPVDTTNITVLETTYPTGLANATLVDFVSGTEPYITYSIDRLTKALVSTNLELTAGTPVDVTKVIETVLGRQADRICMAETTCYPPIPRTLWSALVRGTAAAAMAAVRDPAAVDMNARALIAKKQAVVVMNPRDNRRSKGIRGDSYLRRRSWR